MPKKFSDAKIVDSWSKNAQAWVDAIENQEIESRTLVTNQAIIQAVWDQEPTRVLDLGCGEGWLSRELAGRDMEVLGVDVIPELIATAEQLGGGRFRVSAYENLLENLPDDRFDVIVCNFSLIGKASVEAVFQQVPQLLNDAGSFLIQTLHPDAMSDIQPQQEGWREGSWKGFSEAFTDPAPWYYRPMSAWKKLFPKHGLLLQEIRAPIHPHSNCPASVIFIAQKAVT